MAFHDDRFPLEIAYDSSGGPGFSTAVNAMTQGRQERIPRWATPLWRFNIASGLKTKADIRALIDFYLARNGIANSFKYLDHLDFSSNASDPTESGAVADTDQIIGTGDGSTTQFQLVKTYVSGSQSLVRTIRKPIHSETIQLPGQAAPGTAMNVVISLDNVSLAESGNWSVNTTTGIVTFSSAPGDGVVVRAGFYFDVPVFFGSEIDEAFLAAHVDYGSLQIDEIILEEDRAQYAVNEDIYYGGAISHGAVSTDLAITTAQGRVHIVTAQSGARVLLPDIDTLPGTGGPIFYIYNFLGSVSLTIRDDADTTTLGTVTASNLGELLVGVDSGGNRFWIFR